MIKNIPGLFFSHQNWSFLTVISFRAKVIAYYKENGSSKASFSFYLIDYFVLSERHHWPNLNHLFWQHSESSREVKSREVELGSYSWMDCLAANFLSSCFSDTVFVTLLCTAVEAAISETVRKFLQTGRVPASLALLFWWWLTVSLVFAGQSTDESFISTWSLPPHHFPCP